MSDLKIRNPSDRNPAIVYLSSLDSQNSRRTQESALEAIAQIFSKTIATMPWHKLEYQHVQAIRSKLVDMYAPSTVNRYLSAIRGVLGQCWRLGYITADEYRMAIDVSNIKDQSLPSGRTLSLTDMRLLFQACQEDQSSNNAGKRDLAIIVTLATTGLRRSELVSLDTKDYNEGRIDIQSGKGRKGRTVYVDNAARTVLERWIAVIPEGPMFITLDHRMKRLTDGAIYAILKKRQKQAGIKDFSPHDLRRTFITELLDRDVDLLTVSRLAGHASTDTTGRYDRRGEEVKRKAARLFDLPLDEDEIE